MEDVLDLAVKDLPVFLLIFFRITGIMVIAPVLGNRAVPVSAKIFFSLVLAILFFPLVDRTGVELAPNLAGYFLAVLWELSVGLLIGFVAELLFAGVHFAGYVIDQEVGMRAANILDPITNQGISVIGQLKVLLAMIIYLLIDGHHFLIAALQDSFQAVPLTALRLSDGLTLFVADTVMTDLLRMAIQIAAPAMVTLFLITIAMAFMARTVPEMNIFILGFALRIGVGFIVIFVGVGLFVTGFEEFSIQHDRVIEELVRLMGE